MVLYVLKLENNKQNIMLRKLDEITASFAYEHIPNSYTLAYMQMLNCHYYPAVTYPPLPTLLQTSLFFTHSSNIMISKLALMPFLCKQKTFF